MKNLSVIIPTYKTPEALDLCLRSAIEGQQGRNNQIIVVVDGFYDVNKEILEKYAESIDILNLEENVGTCRATNLGVFNAKNEFILIVNDDNVFPQNWDLSLLKSYQPNSVISPNQIEPYPSMFPQFIIRDLGRDPKTFDLEKFWDWVNNLTTRLKIDETGSTFPFFMSKMDYMKIGGFAEDYPSQSGFVSDVEFFYKCYLSGMKMLRTYNCHFYHFVSISSKSPDQIERSKQAEIDCWEYFKYKWGNYGIRNYNNILQLIK